MTVSAEGSRYSGIAEQFFWLVRQVAQKCALTSCLVLHNVIAPLPASTAFGRGHTPPWCYSGAQQSSVLPISHINLCPDLETDMNPTTLPHMDPYSSLCTFGNFQHHPHNHVVTRPRLN